MHSNSKGLALVLAAFPRPIGLGLPRGWLLPNARLAQCATAIDGAMVEFRRKVNRDPLSRRLSPAGPCTVAEWYTLPTVPGATTCSLTLTLGSSARAVPSPREHGTGRSVCCSSSRPDRLRCICRSSSTSTPTPRESWAGLAAIACVPRPLAATTWPHCPPAS